MSDIENHVVNVSGGRTSAYLVSLFESKRKCEGITVEYVYCDTGAEHPNTYKFLRDIGAYWGIEITCLRTVISMEHGVGPTYRQLDLSECGPDLEPFLDVCKKHGTPTVAAPLCSDRMKSIPADKYCDAKYGKGNYYRWLGMRIDEPRRIKTTEQQLSFFEKKKRVSSRQKTTRYMAEISDFTKEDVLEWWEDQPFNLDLPEHLGNCVFCIKKGANKLALAARDEPEMAIKFIDMLSSDSVHRRPTRGLPPEIMYRNNMSLASIVASYDGHTRDEISGTIRANRSLDAGSCSESCEAATSDPDLFDI